MEGMIVTIILSALLLLFVLISAALFSACRRQKKETEKLTSAVNDYIENGVKTDFSVKDNTLAALQNEICDLENMIELEKRNTALQTEKNRQFISDVSHQLKTPLAAMRLYCEMEKEQGKGQYTDKELLLTEKMENLVKSLLKLEKIRSDTYHMEFIFVDTDALLGKLLEDFRHIFPEKKYSLCGRAVIRCDKAWLSEAIGNIIKNASEHTPRDGIVKISVTDCEKSTLIEISDNGGGVKNEELSKLFTRFYKSENALPESAGIGLAISREIIEKHHGIISAENKNGGLSVNICIPHIEGLLGETMIN